MRLVCSTGPASVEMIRGSNWQWPWSLLVGEAAAGQSLESIAGTLSLALLPRWNSPPAPWRSRLRERYSKSKAYMLVKCYEIHHLHIIMRYNSWNKASPNSAYSNFKTGFDHISTRIRVFCSWETHRIWDNQMSSAVDLRENFLNNHSCWTWQVNGSKDKPP